MAETETLYSVDYIIGELPNIDRKSIGKYGSTKLSC